MGQPRATRDLQPRIDAELEYEQAGIRWRFQASSVADGETISVWRDLHEYYPDEGQWYVACVFKPLTDDPDAVAAEAAEEVGHFLAVAGGQLSASERDQLVQAAAVLAAHSPQPGG